jgi:hypothetical protein
MEKGRFFLLNFTSVGLCVTIKEKFSTNIGGEYTVIKNELVNSYGYDAGGVQMYISK